MFVFALSVRLIQSMLQEGLRHVSDSVRLGIVYPLPLSPPRADA